MGACSNARNWQKALELYEDLKSLKLVQTVSVVNALITALCDGDQFQKAMEVLSEMKGLGLCPNSVTYSMLILASEKKDDLETGQMLLSQAKKDGVACACGDLRGLAFLVNLLYILTQAGLKLIINGARIPNIIILLPVEKAKVSSSTREKVINLAGSWLQVLLSPSYDNFETLELISNSYKSRPSSCSIIEKA
ncbi:hypothetical protein L6164_033324 [Bauhinia variegata]|uniref:Uncharacterized protein n=1 Tax=Bauhinia variegata TaxID=167791 RepID=A0ACB9KRI9_BAUVA|nr:hypothetical protein L6164_033324 [Bauhinia variegata]